MKSEILDISKMTKNISDGLKSIEKFSVSEIMEKSNDGVTLKTVDNHTVILTFTNTLNDNTWVRSVYDDFDRLINYLDSTGHEKSYVYGAPCF